MDPTLTQRDKKTPATWFRYLRRICVVGCLALAVGAGQASAGQSDDALLQAARASGGQTSGTFTFQNQTGRTVGRLIVVFGSAIRSIDYAKYPWTTSGKVVDLGLLLLPPGELLKVAVTVEGKNIRIVSWYWTDVEETPIGTTNKGCSTRQGCDEIKQAGTALDLATPAITIQPGQEITYCYYFKTGNAGLVALSRLRATMANVVRVNLVFTPTEFAPPGTFSAVNCVPLGLGSGSGLGRWVFTAYNSDDEVVFPTNDGAGRPVGLIVPPDQNAYLALVVSNPTDQPIMAQAEIHGDQYPFGTLVTPASPLLVYNGVISLPPGSFDIEIQSCAMPPDATFFWISTYAHRQMVRSSVRDGIDGTYQGPPIFEATDFANPGVRQWTAPPFFRLTSGVMTYQFDYVNPRNITIVEGPSYAVNEVGAVLSYYFPGRSPTLCFNGAFF